MGLTIILSTMYKTGSQLNQNVTTLARIVWTQIQAPVKAATQKTQKSVMADPSSRLTLVLKSALLGATTTRKQIGASSVIQHVCLALTVHKLARLVVSISSCFYTKHSVWLRAQIGLLRIRVQTDARRARATALRAKVRRRHAHLATKSPPSPSSSTRVVSQAVSLTLVYK